MSKRSSRGCNQYQTEQVSKTFSLSIVLCMPCASGRSVACLPLVLNLACSPMISIAYDTVETARGCFSCEASIGLIRQVCEDGVGETLSKLPITVTMPKMKLMAEISRRSSRSDLRDFWSRYQRMPQRQCDAGVKTHLAISIA